MDTDPRPKAHAPAHAARAPLAAKAREAMEMLNGEAGHLAIWLRTQANAPSQKPWFTHTEAADAGQMAQGKVAAGQMKATPHHWKWREISPYLDKIAQDCVDAGTVCWPEPSAFTRFAIYAFIGLLEVFMLFIVSLKMEERRRRRDYAPEGQR